MFTNPEKEFWNNPETIRIFNSKPASPYWRKFFQKIESPSLKKVLDLGCGTGQNAEMLMKMNFEVFACDLHKGMLKATHKRLSKLLPKKELKKRVITASMLDLPFSNGFFDFIIANGTFHNVKSVREFKKAIKESARVLKNKGKICVNLFTDKLISSELTKKERFVYITRQGLHLILLPEKFFLKVMDFEGLKLTSQLTQYERVVSTGKRWITRGVFQKEEKT